MIKHFRSRASAEVDLFRHGFRPHRVGQWIKPGFIATLHPMAGRQAVQVAYAEIDQNSQIEAEREEERRRMIVQDYISEGLGE